jgi:5-methylthioadenosine/S-adenosylhomocysteine deaminase
MNIIIEGGTVLSDKVIDGGGVVIEGNRIVDVARVEDIKRRYPSAGYIRIDAKDKIISPGLINSHTHVSMTLLRGYADDIGLQEWLENWVWPFEAKLTDRDIELGALLGIAESLLGGVTTLGSLYLYSSDHNEITAALKSRIRMVFGVAIFSWDIEGSLSNVRDAFNKWFGSGGGLIRVAPAPHAPYTVSPDDWRIAEGLRREYDEKFGGDSYHVILMTHVLEDWREPGLIRERFGVEVPDNSVYKYLENLGVLSPHFLAAHSIHMNDIDYTIASRNGVKVAHNPVANLKLGMGLANIVEMMRNDILVSLGTDGPASNNTLDLIETMKYASLLPKGFFRDPTVPKAKDVFDMATINGAIALGFEDLGAIRKGYLADIIIIDRKRPNLTPLHNIFSNIIYSLKASDVDTVIVNGDIVVEKRRLKYIDLDDIMSKVDRRAFEISSELRD